MSEDIVCPNCGCYFKGEDSEEHKITCYNDCVHHHLCNIYERLESLNRQRQFMKDGKNIATICKYFMDKKEFEVEE